VPCSRPIPGINASISIAPYASPILSEMNYNMDYDINRQDFDSPMKARILGAIGDSSFTRPTLLQDCPTGNCTFEAVDCVTHVTSGVCSRCVETTNRFVYEKDRVFPVGNTTSMARSVLRLSGSSGLMLVIDPFQAVRLGLAADADPGPLKSSPGLVPSDPLSYLNIVAIMRGACSSQSRSSGLWPACGQATIRNFGRTRMPLPSAAVCMLALAI
jgi:hypothetical protein